MSKRAERFVELLTHDYNMQIESRAVDHFIGLDEGMTPRMLLRQSILDHKAMTACTVEYLGIAYEELFAREGYGRIDFFKAARQAFHHDDQESITGDGVPSMGYIFKCPEEKNAAERKAFERKWGADDNFIVREHAEYEARYTPEAQLAKLADVISVIYHTWIVARFGFCTITRENYRSYHPSTWRESEHFLEMFEKHRPGVVLTRAHAVEHNYRAIMISLKFDQIFWDIFCEVVAVIREFPFEEHIHLYDKPLHRNPPD